MKKATILAIQKLKDFLGIKTDYELALLFTRFAYMQDLENREFIEEFGSGADWFFDISRNRPVVSYEATTGVPLSKVNDFFDLICSTSCFVVICSLLLCKFTNYISINLKFYKIP